MGCLSVTIVSGGLDSISTLVQVLKKGCTVHALSFKYGQKATREVEIARYIIARLNEYAETKGWGKVVEHRVVDLSELKKLWISSQLTSEEKDVTQDYDPSVVVPLRNVLMLTVAAAYAYSLYDKYDDVDKILVAYGAHTGDLLPVTAYGVKDVAYPDCSSSCAKNLERTFSSCHFKALRGKLKIWAPVLEGMSKEELVKTAYEDIDGLLYLTWSCYRNGLYHCGRCESCKLRHEAFVAAGIPDCTMYEHPPGPPEEFFSVDGKYVHKSCVKQAEKIR